MTAAGGHAFVDVLDLLIAAPGEGHRGGCEDRPSVLPDARHRARFFGSVGYEPVAERLSGDGHWGFLLRPGEPREPDWDRLSRDAAAMIAELAG